MLKFAFYFTCQLIFFISSYFLQRIEEEKIWHRQNSFQPKPLFLKNTENEVLKIHLPLAKINLAQALKL